MPSASQIDSFDLQGHSLRVRRLLRLVVCLTMLAGLFGNGIALAAPCILMQVEQQTETMGMSEPCHDEQGCPDCSMQKERAPAEHTNKMPGCLAMIACSGALLATEAGDAGFAEHSDLGEYPTVVIALTGRNLAPDPEPPTHRT